MSLELVSRKQVAAFFGVTHETVHNWEKKGIVKPFCIINGRPRYHLKDVVNAIAKNKGGKQCL